MSTVGPHRFSASNCDSAHTLYECLAVVAVVMEEVEPSFRWRDLVAPEARETN